MLRAWLLWLSRSRRVQRWVTQSRLGRRVARRFVAGETLDEALEVARRLQHQGFWVTLAHLGEWVTHPEDARKAAQAIEELVVAVAREDLPAYVSVKLSHLGVHLSRKLAGELLQGLLARAAEHGVFLRIDMEESELVDVTLDLHRAMWSQGHTHLGLVIQAYLYRSEGDLRRLLDDGVPVRLVKGAYREPPEVAFPRKGDVNANFDRLTRLLLERAARPDAPRARGQGRFPPLVALATHDEDRIAYARECMQRLQLPRDAVEFQMLYGIRRDLQERLRGEGYAVRVYVPYGQEWYPYFMRRLAERPANLFFFLRHLVRG